MNTIIYECLSELGLKLPINERDNLNLFAYGLDSIRVAFLLLKLEKRFNIQIKETELRANFFLTINNIADYIKKQEK